MDYDIIIVGSGISGLYTTYKLLKKNKNLKILIIEKNNYNGGRIKTYKKNINNIKYQFEEGAGRFNTNHHLFLKLLKTLNLSNEIIKLNVNTIFIPSTNYDKKMLNKNCFYYINKVIKKSKNVSYSTLQKYNFEEYAKKILNKKQWKLVTDSYGYYGELINMNAFDAINLFEKGMNPALQFYSLKCGFSYVIDKIIAIIKKNNAKILLNTSVNNINYNQENKKFTIITNDNKIFESKICITCIPKPDLIKLKIYKPIIHLLKSVTIESLCRIYSIFKKKDIWFKDIGKITTNNNSRYIIPINKETGLIMISYSDSKYANYWNKLYNKDKNKKMFKDNIKNNINKILNIKIKNPIFTKVCYWKTGVSMWKKNYNSKILVDKIIQPYNIPLFINGENYSNNQGWIEGALENSEKIINIINKL